MAHSLRSLGTAALNFCMVAQGGLDLYWCVNLRYLNTLGTDLSFIFAGRTVAGACLNCTTVRKAEIPSFAGHGTSVQQSLSHKKQVASSQDPKSLPWTTSPRKTSSQEESTSLFVLLVIPRSVSLPSPRTELITEMCVDGDRCRGTEEAHQGILRYYRRLPACIDEACGEKKHNKCTRTMYTRKG